MKKQQPNFVLQYVGWVLTQQQRLVNIKRN